MRLIDADELKKVATEDWFLEIVATHDNKSAIKKDMENLIDSVPLANTETITHCKDCKHWSSEVVGATEHVKICEIGRYMVEQNGYCVYGEHKERGVRRWPQGICCM